MLRQIDDTVDHEHDPRDAQIRRSHIFNPCCCMTLAGGALSVGIADIFLAILEMGFTFVLEKNTKYGLIRNDKPDTFYPIHTKNPYLYYSQGSVVRELERYGVSAITIFMAFVLIFAVKWTNYITTIVICTCWLLIRIACSLVQIIHAGELLATDADFLHTRGYEIVFMVCFRLYFFVIVSYYSLSIHEDLKDIRAVAPYHGAVDLEDDELHLQDINRIHAEENDVDANFSRKDHYSHMDISEFRLQVAESRSTRLMLIQGSSKPRKNSYNDKEYQAYFGKNPSPQPEIEEEVEEKK